MHTHIIRTAVTLCLVVFMMIQPVMVFGAVAPCASTDCMQQSLMCGGCGCCEIEQAGDKCCCCGGSESSESNQAESPKEQRIESVVSEDDRVGTACHCGVSTPPMNHDGQRNLLVRELATRVVLVQYLTVADLKPPTVRPKVISSTTGSRADFSQRILCVWRI